MAIVKLDDGLISDSFEMGEAPHILRDAIVMPESQYDALTEDEIAAIKQKRYDNWMVAITYVPPDEPTPNTDSQSIPQ